MGVYGELFKLHRVYPDAADYPDAINLMHKVGLNE
jgi:hypothetical protein